jgi:hypothetical protein
MESMTPRSISIRKSHVNSAVKRDSRRCMIAMAIQDSIPWARHIIVDSQAIRFSDPSKDQRYIYLTPPRAQQALIDFDKDKLVKPFTVRLAQGYMRPMRSREAGFKRSTKPRKARTTKTAKRYMPARFREFGIRTSK